LYLQAVAEVGPPDAVIREANYLQKNLAYELTETELQLVAVSHYKLKDEDGYFFTLTELLSRFPKDEYWQNLISQATSKSNVSNKYLLEWFRLYASSGAMQDPDDWLFYAEVALKVGLPHESLEVLKTLKSKSFKLSSEQSKNLVLLEKRVVTAAAEDDKVLKKMSQGTLKDAEMSQFADLNLAKKNWTTAIDLYKTILDKKDPKQSDWLNFHLGVAYFNVGDRANASKQFSLAADDPQLSKLSKLWLVKAN
jgi:predicted Zn-dependent protease